MDGRPSLSPAPGADGNSVDSAYASSDQPSQHSASTRTSPAFRHANMVSIENNGQISGVDGSRHLQLDQNTGEVMDEDTGEVVTTITTTTTTTTTTVRKGVTAGEKKGTTVQVETRPSHPTVSSQQTPAHTHLAEAPGDGPSARLVPDAPPTHLRARSPVPTALQIGRQQPAAEPAPPLRNPNRKSREYAPAPNGPPSPVTPGAQGRHNFSYPARMGTKSTEHLPQIPPETNQYSPPQVPLREQLSQQQTSPVSSGSGVGSALGNLKAAAIGLHVSMSSLPSRIPIFGHALTEFHNFRASAKPSVAPSTPKSTTGSLAGIPIKRRQSMPRIARTLREDSRRWRECGKEMAWPLQSGGQVN